MHLRAVEEKGGGEGDERGGDAATAVVHVKAYCDVACEH